MCLHAHTLQCSVGYCYNLPLSFSHTHAYVTRISTADFIRPKVYCTPIPTHTLITHPHSQRVVLVTGAAGFIGYHVSRALVDNWKATVVGLDLFTDYYDPQLKHDRANELIKIGVTIHRGDVCDTQLLLHLFERYQFTDVIHLAAQAGVRHSLKDPVSYVRNNIQCFQVLLDTLKQFNVSH